MVQTLQVQLTSFCWLPSYDFQTLKTSVIPKILKYQYNSTLYLLVLSELLSA